MDKFKEDAVLGGFETSGLTDEQILLNPKSFQAVGKTRGWKKCDSCQGTGLGGTSSTEPEICFDCNGSGNVLQGSYINNMHRFLDLLIEGKTIEEALSEIK